MNLKCTLKGWPLPHTVNWHKDNELITNGTEGIYHSLQKKGDLLYSTLYLPPGSEDQEGDYVCSAINSIPGWSRNVSHKIQIGYECKSCCLVSPAKTGISY